VGRRSGVTVADSMRSRSQQLRHKRQQSLQGVKRRGLPGDDVFDPARELPAGWIRIGVKLDHKGPGHGEVARSVAGVWHRPSPRHAR
jgi:hypothetical protein